MKSTILLILCLVLTACSVNDTPEMPLEDIENYVGDTYPNIYNYSETELSYGQNSYYGTFRNSKMYYKLGDAYIVKAVKNYEGPIIGQDSENTYFNLYSFVPDGYNEKILINKDPSKLCTEQSYVNCSGSVIADMEVEFYNNKAYGFEMISDFQSDKVKFILSEMDLSLDNKREVLIFENFVVPGANGGFSFTNPNIAFHNNQIFIITPKSFIQYDIATEKETILFEQQQTTLGLGTIYDNKVFFTAKDYLDESGVMHKSITLGFDIETNEITSYFNEIHNNQDETYLTLVTDDHIVYYSYFDDVATLFSLNLETGKEYEIGPYGAILYNEQVNPDTFILDAGYVDDYSYHIVNFEGKILDSLVKDSGKSEGDYYDDDGNFYFYSYEEEHNYVNKMEIKNGSKFGKRVKILEVPKNDTEG